MLEGGLMLSFSSLNTTKEAYQYSTSRGHYRDIINWKQSCFITDTIRKSNKNDKYYFGIYSGTSTEQGEIFVDDVSELIFSLE